MKKYLLIFYSVVSFTLFSQTTSICNATNNTISHVFYPNTTSNFTDTGTISFSPGIYLCGSNTIVYDTTASYGNFCKYVFLNGGAKYYVNNHPSLCIASDVYLAKSNSTLILMSNEKNLIIVYYEPGATIINLTTLGKVFTSTCSITLPTVNCVATGIKTLEKESDKISLYPNPANEVLQLKCENFSDNDIYKIGIYNSIGQLIKEEEIIFKNQTATINTKDLQSGVYVLKLSSQGTRDLIADPSYR